MIKNDKWIKEQASKGMIVPFVDKLVREEVRQQQTPFPFYPTLSYPVAKPVKVISYGVGSYGYDIRLSPLEFKVFRHVPGTVVDPKNFNPNNLVDAELHEDATGTYFILPAHTYGLGVAKELLHIPDNITVICIGKSTYARIGVIANLTPGEAGWRGHLTLEFSNSSSADCKIYANEGVVQLLFFEGEKCDVSYEDRAGKYQDQPEKITSAKV